MNLIERAAKRLEELRVAGAEVPASTHTDSRSGATVADTGNVPTPEVAIHAVGARIVEATGSPQPGGLGDGVVSPMPRVDAQALPQPSSRVLDIDIERLNKFGFVSPDSPKSQLAAEFQVVKRPIIRNAREKPSASVRNRNLVMVTSALPGEGKTFTAVNLAISIAMEFDSTVLLVDGDVAHPSFPDVLGVPASPGLLDLLAGGGVDFASALVKTSIERLSILPAGSRHRRATELLASEQMASLLRKLALQYPDRIIIFDSPPLLATTEARVLATHMGQVVMVVAANATSRHAVTKALATIENCDIVLMMLNKASRTDVETYYGYYPDDKPR